MSREARVGVTVVFFASGAAYGSWVARIPSLQADVDATTSELGLALFGVAAGAVLALPFAGLLVARLGSRFVTRVSLVGVAVALPLIGLAPSLVLLGLAFAVFGVAGSILDVAMNAHGVVVEERYARPISRASTRRSASAGSSGRPRAGWRPPLASRRSHSSRPSDS